MLWKLQREIVFLVLLIAAFRLFQFSVEATGDDSPSGLKNYQQSFDREIILENQRLRNLYGFSERVPVKVAGVGRVVSVDPIGFPTWLSVEASGIRVAGREPAVIAPNGGLVGRVVETRGRHHRVMTILNPLSSISVSLQESRNLGVLKNDGLPPGLKVQYVGNESPVITGEEVVTSALGHAFPAGIAVGSVRQAAPGPGFFQEISIHPKVNFSRLEEVVFVY